MFVTAYLKTSHDRAVRVAVMSGGMVQVVLMFCSSRGLRDGVRDTRSNGKPLLLSTLRTPPLGPPTSQPGPQPISKIMTVARFFRVVE